MSIGRWVGPPRSYSPGRTRAVRFVVVHYTAGSEGPSSAENGAAYDKTRTDGTSTHAFADSDSVCVEVLDGDRSHSARAHGNEIGLQLELCGTAQTREQWLDAVSAATLRNGAKWTAEKCVLYGLPAKRLSVGQTRNAYYAAPADQPRGIVGHVDVTQAFPEDAGDHTDPGPQFPWDVFLAMVAEEVATLNGADMPKLFIITDSNPASMVCISDGATRRWLNGPELTAVMAEWGVAFPTRKVTVAQANMLFGPDVATLKGPKGDVGTTGKDGTPGKDGKDGVDGVVVAHTHTFTGTSGSAQ